jgi:hypothetical protein
MAKKNSNRGGHAAKRRVVHIVGNPEGNREERRAAAKIARMNPDRAAQLPQAPETIRSKHWTPGGGGSGKRSG